MKEQDGLLKVNFIKKIFIKICRILGYEIIDQTSFYIPTQNKNLNENLNIQGEKSINLPLGETKITRKIISLTIILRSCTNSILLQQNKQRLFERGKSEYTFRTLNSLIKSLNEANNSFPNIKFELIIIDNSKKKDDVEQMKKQLKKLNLKNSFISLDVNEVTDNIKKINAKNQNISDNTISNMSKIYKSYITAKNQCEDLVYFVEDDYLHQKNAITEMIYVYERISSQTKRELVLCPSDYPYLYTKINPTHIFLGSNKHWRIVDETLCTFLTSKLMLEKHWNKFLSMCQFEHFPFEQPLHDIYKSEYCLSPIPSLALHCTNVNSIYGLSPNMDWKKIWEENENY